MAICSGTMTPTYLKSPCIQTTRKLAVSSSMSSPPRLRAAYFEYEYISCASQLNGTSYHLKRGCGLKL